MAAVLTNLTKKGTVWKWGPEEVSAFEEMRKTLLNLGSLGVPQGDGDHLTVTDSSDLGGGGTVFQWQLLNTLDPHILKNRGKPPFVEGINPDGTLKVSDFNDQEWILVPLGYWSWKWNAARLNYGTRDQELLSGVLIYASQQRMLGGKRSVWATDQSSLTTFLQHEPPQPQRLVRWYTFLTQFSILIVHIPGLKNEFCDYLSRHSFDLTIGQSWSTIAESAFSKMDDHLDLMARCLAATRVQKKKTVTEHSFQGIDETITWAEYKEAYPDLHLLKKL